MHLLQQMIGKLFNVWHSMSAEEKELYHEEAEKAKLHRKHIVVVCH